jgi:hypothetical protein
MTLGEGDTPDKRSGINFDPELILFGGDTSTHLENPRTIDERAATIQEALGNVGLYGADHITSARLKPLGAEIVKQLNAFTAESVYFNLIRRTRRWLGNEPVNHKQFLQQAKFLHRHVGSLETFQLRQRMEDLDYLYELGINTDQLLRLLKGTGDEKQNVNRLGFLLKSDPPHWEKLKRGQPLIWMEPKLRAYVEGLRANAESDGPWNIELVVIETQELMQKELDEIQKKTSSDDVKGWDSVARELYERVAHRLGSSIALGHVILNSLRNNGTFSLPPQE